ncbi:MAG TPA: efflux RND transporter permease subunit [Terriglobales bacterium]|nr:efflux RND transporter permease subunit [Terriglobales bacterium]
MPPPPNATGLRRILLSPLLWTLIFGALIAYGAYALLAIPAEVLPNFNFPLISVISHEPGATAAELETQIAYPIEAGILALPNTAGVRSTMGDGVVDTEVRFAQGSDPQADLQAIYSAIDMARGQLPANVAPYAEVMGNAINEVADYALRVPATVAASAAQQAVLATVAPALRALPGVQRVDVYGAGQEALWVQPRLAALRHYRVPVTALTQALGQQVLLRPAGYLSIGHQDVFMEARSLPTHIAQLERMPVAATQGPIALGSLAHVVRAPMPTLNTVLLDGQPAVALIVFKQPLASTREVTQAVQALLAANAGVLPAGASWVRIYDQGHIVRVVGSDLTRNLVLGGVLAIGVVLWVLGAGSGIWVLAISIPLALLMAIAGLYATGQSLNMITLGALTVAVGLLADDGIIVLESIYHRWEQGDGHWVGVVQGLRDIAGPDITGTLTTVAVFVPLLFVGGLAGLFFIPFALAMALALLASLLISLSLVPLSLGFLQPQSKAAKPTLAARGLEGVRRANLRLYHGVLRRPGLSLAVCLALLVASCAGLALVPINFLPLPNEGSLLESFSLPPGTSFHDTEAAVETITRHVRRDPAVAHVYARIGSSSRSAYSEPGYAGEIQITLRPSVNINDLTAIGNRVLGESALPAVQEALDTPTIERTGESLSGLPQPFVLDVFGPSIAGLRAVSRQITARLRTVPALSGVFNNDAYPVSELRITPRAAALAAHEMTPAALYQQLDPLLNGEIVARVPEGNVSLALYVRLAGAPQESLAALGRLPIAVSGVASGAGWTPLAQLARLQMAATPNQLEHIAGARALEILATPKGPLGSTIAAAQRALAGLKLPPGYRYDFSGLYAELERGIVGLVIAAVAAFLLMAGIMVLQFDGLLVPGLLLLQAPLAFTGGALLLLISGVGLNAMGLVAFLTLIGIGLNHGIVLLYRARRNEAAGMAPEPAVEEAIHVRFRPIALTALTAGLGMLPTALGWGQGAAPEQGLAVVTLGGIVWSALLSTNLIPALYVRQRRKQLARVTP